jgi:hypothetical protein
MSSSEKFANFVHAFGAARLLLRRANQKGFLIEGLALYSSLTDAFLRIALILKRQLVKQNDDIDDLLTSQEPGGQFYTERQIQRFANSEHVIEDDLFKEIGELYDHRNSVIHKFFLTNLEYAHLPEILERYEKVYNTLFALVYALEKEQIERGVGMTRLEKSAGREAIATEVLKKIDSALKKK